jgi:transcriptional regulator with XRE-family HTH domain
MSFFGRHRVAKSYITKQEKVELDEIIGRNIRSERKLRNLSREELAEMMNLTTSHIGLIERGERGATAVTLSRLARVLTTPIDSFFVMPHIKSVQEERESTRTASSKKIINLLSGLNEAELNFVLHVIQGINKMSSANKNEQPLD